MERSSVRLNFDLAPAVEIFRAGIKIGGPTERSVRVGFTWPALQRPPSQARPSSPWAGISTATEPAGSHQAGFGAAERRADQHAIGRARQRRAQRRGDAGVLAHPASANTKASRRIIRPFPPPLPPTGRLLVSRRNAAGWRQALRLTPPKHAAQSERLAIVDLSALAALLPKHGALLGLDPGEKRIGMAVSDATRLIASGIEAVPRAKFAADAAQIFALYDNEMRRHRHRPAAQHGRLGRPIGAIGQSLRAQSIRSATCRSCSGTNGSPPPPSRAP